MNQFNQSNTDDLQKAIDEITNNANSGSNSDVTANIEAEIKNQLGTPPMPPTDGAPNLADPAAAGVPPMPNLAQPDGTPAPAEATPADGTQGIPNVTLPGTAPAAEAAPAAEPAPAESVAEPITVTVGQPQPAAEAPAQAAPTIAPDQSLVASPADPELAKIKESALVELIPLMDKTGLTAEQKFDVYAQVIESTKDKGIVDDALEAARGIADEQQKAESLLKLVQMIDTL